MLQVVDCIHQANHVKVDNNQPFRIYNIHKKYFKILVEVKCVAEDTKQEQPTAENQDKQEQPITLTEKIATAVLIGYIISLIWLAGSKHWFGIW